MRYYWVTSQSEYSTDVLFRTAADLEELFPRLLQYSTLYFEARDVMTFLGRKLNGNFQGDLVTDQLDFSSAPRAPARPAREAPHEAQLDQDVQQGGAAGRDRHQPARRVPYPQERAPPGKAPH